MTKRQFLAIMYLLTGVIPLIAQTFTEQKKSYPVSADGNKYVVSGFTPFSSMHDENIYANALLWTVKNVCPQLRDIFRLQPKLSPALWRDVPDLAESVLLRSCVWQG